MLGVSQHVSGIGMTLLATGLAFYFYRLVFGQPAMPPNVVPFKPVPIPGLSDIPFFGPVLFNQTALTYAALLAVPVTAYLLYRTSWGLDLRTVGENPRAADAAGISVGRPHPGADDRRRPDGRSAAPTSPSPSSTPSPSASSPAAAGCRSPSSSSACGTRGAAPPAHCSSRSRGLAASPPGDQCCTSPTRSS